MDPRRSRRGSVRRALLAAATILVASVLCGGLDSQAGEASSAPRAPEISAQSWINSGPLESSDLRGRVVLVEFWTFACWNCKNVEPYIKQWHEKYAEQGLLVIAIHTPEFGFERDLENVRKYVEENQIAYPVAVDNSFTTWRRFGNRAWPALYLIDKQGRIRHVRVGEGGYRETEAQIRALLGASSPSEKPVAPEPPPRPPVP